MQGCMDVCLGGWMGGWVDRFAQVKTNLAKASREMANFVIWDEHEGGVEAAPASCQLWPEASRPSRSTHWCAHSVLV